MLFHNGMVGTMLMPLQDRYAPIFDPEYDTFASVRSRSSILFNAICTIGCRVETGKGAKSTGIALTTTKNLT